MLTDLVIGTDPRSVRSTWNRMTARAFKQGNHGPMASGISAIDRALWDVRAKLHGVPLWKELGGDGRPVRAYASGLDSPLSDEDLYKFYAGLLTYPVLMSADIMLYKAMAVPTGKDQEQHVELTRTIARKFNQRFGETFPEPKSMMPEYGAKLMSLTDPKKKMSKSDEPKSCIFLFDEPEVITKKIMSAETDSGKDVLYNITKKPGISNLLVIYSLLTKKSIKEIEIEFKDKGYGEFKKSLANVVVNYLEPFRIKKKEFETRDSYVKEILEKGQARARVIAEATMKEVREKMGII
jgi:tryptophanyl-tRNA synthetase